MKISSHHFDRQPGQLEVNMASWLFGEGGEQPAEQTTSVSDVVSMQSDGRGRAKEKNGVEGANSTVPTQSHTQPLVLRSSKRDTTSFLRPLSPPSPEMRTARGCMGCMDVLRR